ncbi:MAG: 4Fe-4S binding protein, partial [Alphaproteobacteria bacterium]|nr:4Fe-4S binding protein [Alphaproteobacteria bacterium]
SKLPILGIGGISGWRDAAEYMTVGADAVQVCTEVMVNGYGIFGAMKKGLTEYLESKGFNSPADLKNRAIANLSAHKALDKQKQVYPHIDDAVCVKCGKCVTICDESEHSALSLVDGRITADRNACVGCALCSLVCPKSAIAMK